MDFKDPARLTALQRSGLMRKEVAERLVHICYTAHQLLRADGAQLNVLDDQKQYVQAEWPPAELDPIPIELSGCQEVVKVEKPLVVPDTREHPVMCLLPWSGHWGGYLGVPLCYDGHVIGALCALSHETRNWSDQDVLALQSLSQLATWSLENKI